jgi:hypothetical protein
LLLALTVGGSAFAFNFIIGSDHGVRGAYAHEKNKGDTSGYFLVTFFGLVLGASVDKVEQLGRIRREPSVPVSSQLQP